jgi:hypothetical protein
MVAAVEGGSGSNGAARPSRQRGILAVRNSALGISDRPGMNEATPAA